MPKKSAELKSVAQVSEVQKQTMPLRSYAESNLERDVKKLEKQVSSLKVSIANHAQELDEKKESMVKLEGELKSLQLIKSIAKTMTL